MSFHHLSAGLCLAAALNSGSAWCADMISVSAPDSQVLQYALGKLESAVATNGAALQRGSSSGPAVALRVAIDPSISEALGADGFRLEQQGRTLAISASTDRGAMYGVLDVAEQIRLGTAPDRIAARDVKAPFEFRAIKFNLPWAAYRTSFAIEQHDETCRDLRFWEAFLDMMAANRFNVLTLWSLHPFHYLVRPRSFPEACPFNDTELAEWQRLWHGLFALARERGIETYLINWNIFVSPEFARAHQVARWSETGAHYGQTPETNAIVTRYTREVISQVLDEYPELTGLGITLGEQMGGMTPDLRRAWLEQTIFAGIADARRPARFIYRAPLSANTGSGGTTSEENDRRTRAQIESLTRNITGPVFVEFKHNWSHALSSPDLFIVHGGKLSDAYWAPPPTRHKIVWTMRNEDIFVLRWGQPDFVREFVRNQSQPHVAGAIIGSECYVPALDYITRPGPHKNWRYAFERQWLYYATWGRLLHDPSTPDAIFTALLEERFGTGSGKDLLEAWKLASRVPHHFASFHKGTWDGSLYTEGFSSWSDNGPRRFFDIESFITHPVLDTKRYININDFVKAAMVAPASVMSPPDLARRLERDCAGAMARVAAVRKVARPSPTLECELTDVEAWCAFGAYFAEKLRGGVALAEAKTAGGDRAKQEAVAALQRALVHWKRLAELGERFNQLPIPSNSKEQFSWSQLLTSVEQDIAVAQKVE